VFGRPIFADARVLLSKTVVLNSQPKYQKKPQLPRSLPVGWVSPGTVVVNVSNFKNVDEAKLMSVPGVRWGESQATMPCQRVLFLLILSELMYENIGEDIGMDLALVGWGGGKNWRWS
jgi:hypothetical protein